MITPSPRWFLGLSCLSVVLLAGGGPALAQEGEWGRPLPVLVPESAGSSPHDPGNLFHTKLRVLDTARAEAATAPSGSVLINTPTTVRTAYALPATGGSNAIAIVDAYDYPTSLKDFNAFATQYGLPKETSSNLTASTNKVFQVVYANGRKPTSGGDYIASWNLEEALDIEWAHALAPGAKIYLVEAASASNSDLFLAVQVAAALPGVKEVSMSWGEGEWSAETRSDSTFTRSGVVFLAAGGDTSDTIEYPAASPNVVSVGGTSLNRNSLGVLTSETAWDDTGCGLSLYEPRPAWQAEIAVLVGNKRGTNDLSCVADPNTGVNVYDSTPLWGSAGWWVVGGTSLATPSVAGVLNLAATASTGFAASSTVELTRIYNNLGNSAAFRDVTSGIDGNISSVRGWDFITGVGSPLGLSGK